MNKHIQTVMLYFMETLRHYCQTVMLLLCNLGPDTPQGIVYTYLRFILFNQCLWEGWVGCCGGWGLEDITATAILSFKNGLGMSCNKERHVWTENSLTAKCLMVGLILWALILFCSRPGTTTKPWNSAENRRKERPLRSSDTCQIGMQA